jgi:hypothetical protein
MKTRKSDHPHATSEMTAEEWNTRFAPGTRVTLTLSDDSKMETRTRSRAWNLGHGVPVVLVDGKTGGWELSRILPSPILWQEYGELKIIDDGGTPILRVALTPEEHALLKAHAGVSIRLTIEKVGGGVPSVGQPENKG